VSRKTLIVATIVALLFGLFYNLGNIELRGEEPRRAIVAMEMVFSGNYTVPHLNGWVYLNKPPLFNWLLVVFFKLLGSMEEWVVRLPSLLSFLGIGLLNYWLAKKFLRKEIALMGSFLFLFGADMLFYGTLTTGEIDLFLAFIVYIQVFALFWFYQQKAWLKMFLVSYFFLGIGILTKGVPSIAFQGLTLLGIAVLYKDWKFLFRWQHFVGVALATILAGGYFYAYALEADLHTFVAKLLDEGAEKTDAEGFGNLLQRWVEFPLLALKNLAPASLLIPFLFQKNLRATIKENPFIAFSCVFVLANIWLYWFAGEFRSRYLYPFLPVLGNILAWGYFQYKEAWPQYSRALHGLFKWVMLVLPAGLLSLPFLPVAQFIPNVWWVAILGMLILFLPGLFYLKQPKHILLHLFLFMALGRIEFNFVFHPVTNSDPNVERFEPWVNEMLEITEGESFELWNPTWGYTTGISLGPIALPEVEILTPPHIRYELNYYYSQKMQEPLRFVTETEPGKYYLAFSSHAKDQQVDASKFLMRIKKGHWDEMVLVGPM